MSSWGTNLGPSNPKLIGNVPGVSIDTPTNPYATPADPYCLPVESTDESDNPITDAAGNPVYEKNKDGTYVCDPNTVPERAMAYRELNGLAPGTRGAGRRGHVIGVGARPADLSRERAAAGRARVAGARGLTRSISAGADRQAHARASTGASWGSRL